MSFEVATFVILSSRSEIIRNLKQCKTQRWLAYTDSALGGIVLVRQLCAAYTMSLSCS